MVGSSSSTPRGKSFLSVLRRTRKIINKIVIPHPSFDFPRSPPARRTPPINPIRNPPQLSNTGWDVSNVSTLKYDRDDLPSVLSPCNQHISDRNGQHQGTIGPAGRTSVLRRTKGTIRSPSRTHDENPMNFLAPSLALAEYRPLIATLALSEPYQPRHEPLTPIPEQADSPAQANNNILLSCSSSNSLAVSSADSAIHFVDEASGTVISRVQRASGSRISAEQFALEPSSLKSSLSLHFGSPPSCAASDIDAHIDSLPSFMLTLPTPISLQSPIFSPAMRCTTEEPLNAAEAAASLPRCDHVLSGRLCRTCDQMRVWFQNSDGGASEPRAQSTLPTRAVWGVCASSPSGVGLGLTECWDEGGDDEDDIDDPGSLAIEVLPPRRSGLVLMSQRVKAILRKVRVGFGVMFPFLSTLPLGDAHRKHA